MESEIRVAGFKMIQNALRVLTALQLTSYMWPPHAQVHDGASFDFIVVGAGTAGSVVANRLTEDPNIRVLLIEAGGDPPMEATIPSWLLFMKQSRYDWNYTLENNKYMEQCHQRQPFQVNAGKVLGGTSSSNFMIYGRGIPHSYEAWATAAKDDTWKWENVLPFFTKLERIKDPELLDASNKNSYGTDGNVQIVKHPHSSAEYLEALKEHGHFVGDVIGNGSLGFSDILITMAEDGRQGSARSYLSPIKDRPNLYVLKNTMVTKILFDDDKNAIGVNAIIEDGHTITLKATKEVIVSAGAFNSPKLLMLSGVGPKDHLQSKNIDILSDLPVGENLIDCITTTLVLDMEEVQKTVPFSPQDFPAKRGVTGFVALDKSQAYADYQIINYISDAHITVVFCVMYFQLNHEICSDFYKAGQGRTQIHTSVVNLNTKSRGKVQLRSSDPADPPLIYPKYFSDQEDFDNLVDYVADYAPVFNTTYLRSIKAEILRPVNSKCSELGLYTKAYWRCYTTCMMSGLGGYMGTCAMGSVVDGRLRVRGVKRLRVADASVIPTPNGANPYGLIMMIGEKAADFIKKDYSL